MRIIAQRTLREFWQRHADAESALRAWYLEATQATWSSMAEVKRRYPHASVIDRERVVFNIAGNRYRLAVKLWFPGQMIWIKFIGTHRQYDDIDVTKL